MMRRLTNLTAGGLAFLLFTLAWALPGPARGQETEAEDTLAARPPDQVVVRADSLMVSLILL